LSTEHCRRYATGALLLGAALLACAPRTVRGSLDALCATPPAAVAAPLTLWIDSVIPAAPESLRRARGEPVRLTLTLHPDPSPILPLCQDREGVVTREGELPGRLEQASTTPADARWRIEGGNVIVDFDPRSRDNNFALSLPLVPGTGRWWLSTIAGEVAQGRVTRP
jgi:hypothetical protein